MKTKTDKLAIGFLYIITQLNSGEKLTPKELALKFDVTERIIQKDLNTKRYYTCKYRCSLVMCKIITILQR